MDSDGSRTQNQPKNWALKVLNKAFLHFFAQFLVHWIILACPTLKIVQHSTSSLFLSSGGPNQTGLTELVRYPVRYFT